MEAELTSPKLLSVMEEDSNLMWSKAKHVFQNNTNDKSKCSNNNNMDNNNVKSIITKINKTYYGLDRSLALPKSKSITSLLVTRSSSLSDSGRRPGLLPKARPRNGMMMEKETDTPKLKPSEGATASNSHDKLNASCDDVTTDGADRDVASHHNAVPKKKKREENNNNVRLVDGEVEVHGNGVDVKALQNDIPQEIKEGEPTGPARPAALSSDEQRDGGDTTDDDESSSSSSSSSTSSNSTHQSSDESSGASPGPHGLLEPISEEKSQRKEPLAVTSTKMAAVTGDKKDCGGGGDVEEDSNNDDGNFIFRRYYFRHTTTLTYQIYY